MATSRDPACHGNYGTRGEHPRDFFSRYIRSPKVWGWLELAAVRGEAGVDLAALEDLALRVSRLAADFPQITKMDFNPVFCYPVGAVPVVVEVRLKVN